MAPALVFEFEEKKVSSTATLEALRKAHSLEHVEREALEKLGLGPGTYDFYDAFGRIEHPEDLYRAISMASGECCIKVKEHSQFVRIRKLEEMNATLQKRISSLEASLKSADDKTDQKIEAATTDLKFMINRVEKKVNDEILPSVEGVVKDKTGLQKDIRAIMDKLNSFNLSELQDLGSAAKSMLEEMKACSRRVNELDTQFQNDKAMLNDKCRKNSQELVDLQKYVMGKLDICIVADADIRRDQQIALERMQLVADDLRLLTEEHRRLANQCNGALEESEDLRLLIGQVREDNEHVKADQWQVSTRVHCLEGVATERWEGFAPGVLYFRSWHRYAKGSDVQLSKDLSIATGRGFLATTGVVLGNDEGLAVGDGPCRRFGTPGQFSSYYELEIDETTAAPAGAGGLFVGLSLQSAEEIASHPRKEFDGWLLGGHSKALICRAGSGAAAVSEDYSRIPDTFGVDVSESARKAAVSALKLLRAAMPPKQRGEMREVESVWRSETLRMGDRVGVLFRCSRNGGARLRITVNGDIIATHNFLDAPPSEAIGFLTPVIRLAGTGKAAKILPGLSPPSRILADDM